MILIAAAGMAAAVQAQEPVHIRLWDNSTAPTSNGLSGEEKVSKGGAVSNTTTAEMWVYKAGENATGQGIVFFPGGGYSNLSLPNGHKTAKWFAEHGITAAVVKYRLPNGHSEIPRNDADEALRVMKARADEFGVDRRK